MKIKKKYKILIILLSIFLFFLWCAYEAFRVPECHELDQYKKANEIIRKIEEYKKCHGKIPDSLEDIGEAKDSEFDKDSPWYKYYNGSIFYSNSNNNDFYKVNEYSLSFYAGSLGCLFCSCSYNSKTKEWLNYD